MNVTIAGTTFDQHEYDERGDVLYLSAGAPRAAARTSATPEGHAMDYERRVRSSAWASSPRGSSSNVTAR